MPPKKKIIIVSGIIATVFIIGVISFSLTGAFVQTSTGQYDEFAECLTDSGAIVFGAYWCPHCESQKKMFGSSFDFVKYVECDPRGTDANPQLCQQYNIRGYPTWLINDRYYEGEQSLQTLSYLSGCSLS